MKSMNKIGFVGSGHLGRVYAVALASMGYQVVSLETGKNNLEFSVSAKEPGLEELREKNIADKKLIFTKKIQELSGCDVVWLAMDMPIKQDGYPKISAVEEVFKDLIPVFKNGVTVVVSSQVPVGTGIIFQQMIKRLRPDLKFSYVYQPENLQLGRALESFLKPARVVIGTENKRAEEIMKNVFSPLGVSVLTMDVASAEMVKHALNSFLAASLSFIYDIADLCEEYGADVVKVSQALKSDSRIGQGAYLDASIGFSGGTLGRDLRILLDKAAAKNLEAPVLRAAVLKNKNRWQMIEKILKNELSKSLKNTKIGILGVTYKPGTSILRHSLSLKVIKDLAPKVAGIRVHDPLADKKEVEAAAPCIFYKQAEEMAKGYNILVLMTACPEYQKLDFIKISKALRPPRLFLDTKNFLWNREEEIKKAGLRYRGIGRGHEKLKDTN